MTPIRPTERRNVVLAQAGMQIAELNAYLELTPRGRRPSSAR